MRCASLTVYLAHEKIKGEGRGRRKHKNNVRVVRNLEERNVGTKEKNPKQDLTSAKVLTIELSEVAVTYGWGIILK